MGTYDPDKFDPNEGMQDSESHPFRDATEKAAKERESAPADEKSTTSKGHKSEPQEASA